MSKYRILYDSINLILLSASAYPTTVYEDYATDIAWTGTLSTTVSGTPTCSTAPPALGGAKAAFPSHPLLPAGVQDTNIVEDPRGWTYVPVEGVRFGDTFMIKNLFPDLGVWNCISWEHYFPFLIQGGPAALQTALYLTTTSTSTEIDDGPTSAQALAEITPSPKPHTEKKVPAEIFNSQAPPARISSTEPLNSYVPPVDHPPDVSESANELLPAVPNTPAPASKSINITPSPTPATTFPTTPVAVLIPHLHRFKRQHHRLCQHRYSPSRHYQLYQRSRQCYPLDQPLHSLGLRICPDNHNLHQRPR